MHRRQRRSGIQFKLIANLAATQRLPVIYNTGINADTGGLMFCGATQTEMHRKAATCVDRVLKGANPTDLLASSDGE